MNWNVEKYYGNNVINKAIVKADAENDRVSIPFFLEWKKLFF